MEGPLQWSARGGEESSFVGKRRRARSLRHSWGQGGWARSSTPAAWRSQTIRYRTLGSMDVELCDTRNVLSRNAPLQSMYAAAVLLYCVDVEARNRALCVKTVRRAPCMRCHGEGVDRNRSRAENRFSKWVRRTTAQSQPWLSAVVHLTHLTSLAPDQQGIGASWSFNPCPRRARDSLSVLVH